MLAFFSITLGLCLILGGYCLWSLKDKHLFFEKKRYLYGFFHYIPFLIAIIWVLIDIIKIEEPYLELTIHPLTIFLFVVIIAILSFIYLIDSLMIRGIAILFLKCANPLLNEAFLEESLIKLPFVIAVYILIVISLILVVMPFLFFKFIKWCQQLKLRIQLMIIILCTYGIILCLLSQGFN